MICTMQVEIATNRAPSGRKPSAETGLHIIYACSRRPNATARPHGERHGALAAGERGELHISGV